MNTRRLHNLLALFAAVALAGCGIADPYTHSAVRSRTATPAPRPRPTAATVTDPSEPPPAQPTTTAASGVTAGTSSSGAARPRQALRLYARLYVNWTATTIAAHQRHLAAISQGTARAAALQAAASYSHDAELESSHVANTGAIVSIAPGEGPQRSRWVIVASEHTTGSGHYTGLPAAAQSPTSTSPTPPRLGHRPMVAAELNQPQHVTVASAAVIGVTLASGLVAVLDPAIAGSAAPHPTLTGSLTDWLGITAENLRVLAAPFLLGLLGADKSRLGRGAGDLIVVAVIAVNAIPVGIALGRWRIQLIPYVPQLPLEWAALILAVSAWLTIRTTTATRHQIAVLGASTAALVLAAAALETWSTPHRPAADAGREAVDAVHRRSLSCGGPGVAFATDFAPGRPGRCKVARFLPLTPFGSARSATGADRATSTTPGPPQGGTTT